MKMITMDHILIKNAWITAHDNRIKSMYGLDPREYWLHLTEKQFNMFREMGCTAKKITTPTETDFYFINVKPVCIPETKYNPFIEEPSEDEFLEKNHLNIKFFVYTVNLPGKEYRELCFRKDSIEKGD